MSKTQAVIIGVDPHKMSVTIEVVDTHEQLLGTGLSLQTEPVTQHSSVT